jgi:hypothetical protein
MAISKNEFEAADKRVVALLAKTPTALAARYIPTDNRIFVDLSTGISIAFKPNNAQGLERANAKQLAEIEISPSGLGLHFPALGADIYLPSLLEGFLGPRQWMAAQLGKVGGRARSRRKKVASRANGKRGGRPKKTSVGTHVA